MLLQLFSYLRVLLLTTSLNTISSRLFEPANRIISMISKLRKWRSLRKASWLISTLFMGTFCFIVSSKLPEIYLFFDLASEKDFNCSTIRSPRNHCSVIHFIRFLSKLPDFLKDLLRNPAHVQMLKDPIQSLLLWTR